MSYFIRNQINNNIVLYYTNNIYIYLNSKVAFKKLYKKNRELDLLYY